MYSEEIKYLLQLRNELITINEYIKIVSTSPQINHIKYEDNYFKISTDDNYNFKFKIKEIEKN